MKAFIKWALIGIYNLFEIVGNSAEGGWDCGSGECVSGFNSTKSSIARSVNLVR